MYKKRVMVLAFVGVSPDAFGICGHFLRGRVLRFFFLVLAACAAPSASARTSCAPPGNVLPYVP